MRYRVEVQNHNGVTVGVVEVETEEEAKDHAALLRQFAPHDLVCVYVLTDL